MMLERGRAVEILAGMKNVKVLVVGDIMLDEYVWGDTTRISPEAPVPVVKVMRRTHGLGGSGNVVQNLRGFGCGAHIVSAIGEDPRADELRRYLDDSGAVTDGLRSFQDRPTTWKTRIIARGQQVVRVDDEVSGDLSDPDVAELTKEVLDKLDAIDAVIISDYGKGVVTGGLLSRIIPLARQKGKIVAVDPKYPKFLEYKGVSLLTPNTDEAGEFLGRRLRTDEDIVRCGWDIVRELGCDQLLITRGGDGMSLFVPGKDVVSIPTMAIEVFDVTGAGDTVISVFTAALATGARAEEAAALADLAAGVVVRKVGTATATPSEVLRLLDVRGSMQ